MEWQKHTFRVTDDREAIDMSTVVTYLHTTYWANDRPESMIRRSWQNSAIVFGLFDGAKLIGFARVISDLTIVGYLADVFVDESYRGQGLGSWLLECIFSHPELDGLRWVLHTRDMHALYRKFGFIEPREITMERPRATGV
jgi:GNAT superfamily N-acetyltransferase